MFPFFFYCRKVEAAYEADAPLLLVVVVVGAYGSQLCELHRFLTLGSIVYNLLFFFSIRAFFLLPHHESKLA